MSPQSSTIFSNRLDYVTCLQVGWKYTMQTKDITDIYFMAVFTPRDGQYRTSYFFSYHFGNIIIIMMSAFYTKY